MGYFGGKAFEDDHTKAFITAFVAAMVATVLIEVIRHVAARRSTSQTMAIPGYAIVDNTTLKGATGDNTTLEDATGNSATVEGTTGNSASDASDRSTG